jgi:hypothetical protein
LFKQFLQQKQIVFYFDSMSLLLCATLLSLALMASSSLTPVSPGMTTFGSASKKVNLTPGGEEVFFQHRLSDSATHGAIQLQYLSGIYNFDVYVRIYVDEEDTPSIQYPVGFGHAARPPLNGNDDANTSPGIDDSPWASSMFGRTATTGFYNTYLIPFGKTVTVTLENVGQNPNYVWYMVRGMENAPLGVSGLELPNHARLKVNRTTKTVPANSLVTFADVTGSSGLLHQVIFAANSSTYLYQEGCVSSIVDGNSLWLSSGLEDYFFGSYFHSMHDNHLPYNGFTLNTKTPPPGCQGRLCTNSMLGYRIHEHDPILFAKSLQVNWIASGDNDDKEQGWCNFKSWPADPLPSHLPNPTPENGSVSVDILSFVYTWNSTNV